MHQIFDTDFNCKTFHIILNFIFHIFNFFPVMNIISISTGFAHDILDVRCPDRTYLMLKCVFIYPLHFIWELSSSGDVMGPKAILRRISKFINVVYPWNFTRYFLILHYTSKNAQKFSWNLSSGKLQIKASIPLCDHRVQSERQCRQYVLCNWSINERSSTSDNDIHLLQARKVSQNILQTTSWAERKMTFRKKTLKCIFFIRDAPKVTFQFQKS